MKVLVTGGSGNIGVYIVERLKDKHDVTVLDMKESETHPELPFLQVDLTDSTATKEAVKGFDAIVHFAAVPNPYDGLEEACIRVNPASTWSILEAARVNGVRRVVYAGSDSETGFGIHAVEHKPLYVPIDEDHPCWPHESYSLSKYFGEFMCREYSRAFGIETVSLRLQWVWLDICMEGMERAAAREEGDVGNDPWLGSYIFPEDVAQGVELALDHPMRDPKFPFEAFFISAAETFYKMDTLDVLARVYPDGPPPVKRKAWFEANPRASTYDFTKAREELGFKPEFSWRDIHSDRRVKFEERSGQ